MTGVRDLHAELSEKSSLGHVAPGLETSEGRVDFEVVDPFGNCLRFGEVDE